MDQKHPLGVLIDTVRKANGWSYETVALKGQRKGHKLAKSTVEALAKRPAESVHVRQVRALADALDVSERVVLEAFLESMGYSRTDRLDLGVEGAIRVDTRLSSDDKRLLLTMVEQMRGRRQDVVTRGPWQERPADDLDVQRGAAGTMGEGETVSGDDHTPDP